MIFMWIRYIFLIFVVQCFRCLLFPKLVRIIFDSCIIIRTTLSLSTQLQKMKTCVSFTENTWIIIIYLSLKKDYSIGWPCFRVYKWLDLYGQTSIQLENVLFTSRICSNREDDPFNHFIVCRLVRFVSRIGRTTTITTHSILSWTRSPIRR